MEKKSLLSKAAAARKGKPEESESEIMLREEQELLRNVNRQKALKGVKELAKVNYCAVTGSGTELLFRLLQKLLSSGCCDYRRAACQQVDTTGNPAQGVIYSQAMRTDWKAPGKVRRLAEAERQEIRDKFHIIVEGSDLPPPVVAFQDLKLPRCILDALRSKGISKPTPIQMQVSSCGVPSSALQ